MEWGVRLPLLLLLLFSTAKAQWEDPALSDPENEDVSFTILDEVTGNVYYIQMNEELEPPIVIAKLNFKACEGCSQPVITNFETGSNQFLEAEAKEDEDGSWQLVVNRKVDYELLSNPRFTFVISNEHNVLLEILNIDDNPPSVIPITIPCEIEENYNGPTDCFYDISDVDGWLQYMTWNVTGTRDEALMFDFKYVNEVSSNSTKLATTEMVLKDDIELDYETYSAHLLTWTVTDSGDNSVEATIIVNVIDLPDTPPRWNQIFSVEQFEEKSTQEFVVNAIDGDIAINDAIFYTMISSYGDLFSIDNLTGVITVEGIDRDALQQEIFVFTLRATEEHEPNFYIEQDVTFIVSDINDHAPTIIQPESKVLYLKFPEARITDIEDVIDISDIDSSANAMYTVTLTDSTSNSYNSPFQVIPSQGYQNYSFSLSIINSTLLDYEDDLWRSFTFRMFVQETVDENHTDELIINVELTNWNDESPIFSEENYIAKINETIGINELIIQVVAVDRDIDDSVRYELVGSSANRILTIDEETGVITTSVSNAFDYERQTEMIVQILAEDTLVDEYESRHRTYAQLTIEVGDVNDETPRITVGSTASILENQEDGANIPVQITATDEDTTADLLFYINWDQSYATKSGRSFYFTSVELSGYKESVVVATENVEDSSGYVRAVMTISETVKDNTPDYEMFDTLYLSLTVEDLNQEVNLGTDTVTVTVFIEDVNDNAPVFTEESITANNTVMEASGTGSTVGTIVATDADGPDYNTVTYYLTEVEGTPVGLITIDPTSGMLTVSSEEISADTPEKRWYLSYEVTASDGEWDTTANINIFIIDINNNDPVFDDFDEVYEVEEKSPNGTPVAQLIATDNDRDEPYNVVWYAFTSTTSNDAREVFTLDTDSGQLEVTDRNGVTLDRDEGIAEFTISFRAGDNRYGSYQRYSEEQTIKIVLLDINDQFPIIQTTSIEVSESLEKGTKITESPITATDKDDPNTSNTDIQFTLKGLQDSNGDEVEQLFEIASQELTGVAILSTIKDLKNYYGEYTLVIETNDLGINPETGEHNYYTNEISVTITKYNFEDPVFTYPTDELRVFLSKTQDLNRQLYLYNYDPLPHITADDQQGGKWDIQFSIDQEQSEGGSLFTISNYEGLGESTGMLQLVQYPEDWEGLYKLHIVANDNGEPPKTASINLYIRFYDPDSLPYFPEGQRLLQTNFTENSTGLEEVREFYAASYNYGSDEEEWEFEIYYLLLEGDADLFSVNSATREISLKEVLDREEVDYYQLKIIASNSESLPTSYDERSVLVVDIEVIDINDNPPHFYRSYYSNGISTTTSLQSTVVTLSAYDLDKDETLTFTIVEGSLQTVGAGISELSAPFELDLYSGVITLNFRVQANMDGYFVFTVQVTDSPPENHTDTATVQIFIITDANRVELTFENPLDAVITLQDTVQEVLEEFFEYTCNIESILSATDQNGQTVDTQTAVTVHFVDPEESVPINKTEIQSKLSDIEFFTSLRATFINNTLYLLSYSSTSTGTDNIEEQLKAWLIGVSVTLGCLCIVILIAFILKTRSLKRRLDNLSTVKAGSQDSGLNRIGIALPNTNKNALECSNPLYNEEKRMPDIDQSSIHSGDSDLIGVEDNPEFDYVPNTKL